MNRPGCTTAMTGDPGRWTTRRPSQGRGTGLPARYQCARRGEVNRIGDLGRRHEKMAAVRRSRWGALLFAAVLLAAACSGGASSSSTGTVTLHALFMKQAGYSDADVAAMTSAFEAAHPNIKVQTEFVAYEALHDKIVTDQIGGSGIYDTVLMDTIWPAEFAKSASYSTSPTSCRPTSRPGSSTPRSRAANTTGTSMACRGSTTSSSSSTTRRCSPRPASRARRRRGTSS